MRKARNLIHPKGAEYPDLTQEALPHMSASILSKPGTLYGPCNSPCAHKDCAVTRSMAKSKCRICGKPIGYDTRYYSEPGDILVHAVCLESDIEKGTKQ